MTKKKPATVFLVAFVEGGNLTSLVTNTRSKLIDNILDLAPHHRDRESDSEDGSPLSKKEIGEIVDGIAKKRGNRYRFEDRLGDADLSIMNITGMVLKPGMEVWK